MQEHGRQQLQACTHQVGGHFSSEAGDFTTYVDAQGRFYKAVQDPERGGREAAVYQLIFTDELSHEQKRVYRESDLMSLRAFVPRFYGTSSTAEKHLLVLEDTCFGYRQPCVLDVKVGYTTVHPWMSEAKQAKSRAKDEMTTQSSLGFRATGYRVWDTCTQQYRGTQRAHCRTLTHDTLPGFFTAFAQNGALTLRDIYGGPQGAVAQVEALAAWFASQRSLQFFAASVLMVYEGDATCVDDARVRVRLIDFAHTFPSEGRLDENVLRGLHSLVDMLTRVACTPGANAGRDATPLVV